MIGYHRLRVDSDGTRVYRCPVCEEGEVRVSDNVFYGKCDVCDATLIDYVPLQHQEAFHMSNAQYRLNIGGFGSGKTTAACVEVAAHALSTPNGRTLITAPILAQVRDAVLPELEKVLPPWFLETSRKSPTPYYKLLNGHEILVYSSNDEQNLRSLNLTAFYIEEASGVDYSVFSQLMTRLRNRAGVVRDAQGHEVSYKFMGILATNPEDGWIRDNFLLISSKIVTSPSIDPSVYTVLSNKKGTDKHFHTFISSTRDNRHIPTEFIERMSAGKSPSWVRKYVDCYLDYREGAVFPEFAQHLVEPFPIPNSWKRVYGYDPGYNDPTAFISGAINPDTGVVYIYDDYEVAEKPMGYHATQVLLRTKGMTLYKPIQGDPSARQRNNRDGESYFGYMRKQYNLRMEPANNDILYGIEKMRDYFYCGKLKIFNSCENLKREMASYVYKPSAKINTEDQPIDKNNHTIDALRYIVAVLPENPNELKIGVVFRDLARNKVRVFQSGDKTNPSAKIKGRVTRGVSKL